MDDLRLGRRLRLGVNITLLAVGLALGLAACGSAAGPDAAVSSPPDGGDSGNPDPSAAFVVPRPGQLDVHDVAADRFEATVDGSTITVTATWTSGVEPCSTLDTVVVDQRMPGVISVTLREGRGPEEVACIAIAMEHQTRFDIPDVAPGTYTIRDGAGNAPDLEVVVG
jgi:hypothetical protein